MRTPWWTSYFSRRPRRMEIVSSTDGWSTSTGWKRRSRAASFSMCRRYSSSVVAPMVCSSPRASIGLSRLLASIAPSAAPAPTTVCSSSMKRMIRPSESLISLRTAFRRSSNSPRYLAPATIEPRSRQMTLFSFRVSGTSPRTMRWARPSTTAVLPTPGSPISTGLFLVRRDRTWMTRRISSSRPITGSSLPARASAVRSRPYFSRAWYVASGFWLVTRWPPRTPARAWRIASLLAPLRSSSCWASPPPSATARRRCSVETYSSRRRRASSEARSMARLNRGSADREPPWIFARLPRIAASSARKAGTSTPRRRSVSAGVPSSTSTSAARRCSESRTGLCSSSASRCAATIDSWAFWVKWSRFMVPLRSFAGSAGRSGAGSLPRPCAAGPPACRAERP